MPVPDSLRVRYEALVQAYAADLYRFAYRLTGKTDMAQDLVQETFLEAWRSIAKQSSPGKERSWLFAVLRHRWAHQLRDASRRIQPRDGSDLLGQQPSSDAGILDRLVNSELLQSALDGLEPRFKEAFLMIFLQGLSCKEAAAELNVPLGTVLSRVSRARQSMREALARIDHQPVRRSTEASGK